MPTEGGISPAPSSGLTPLAAEAAAGSAPLPVSLYVHVPFCVSKCAYCDFYSLAGEPASWYARYVDAVLFEAGHFSHFDLLDDVPTLYFGGGTPTVLGPELVRLVGGLRETARLRPDAEITVETNPETTDAAGIEALAAAGVNRFSLGVQSFDDDVLRVLGRCHDAAKAFEALHVLQATGLEFSIDLMCGVPGQTLASWDSTLERALDSGARHVSVYPLAVEEGTPLAAAIAAGRIPAPDPDVAADMMLAAETALTAAGLPRYEVANYAQPGREAAHNVVYWTGGAYLGLGPAAASMLPYEHYARVADAERWPSPPEGEAPTRARFTHGRDVAGYVHTPLVAPAEVEFLSRAEAAREDVMLGLRMATGVPVRQAEEAGVERVLERLAGEGLVHRVAGAEGADSWVTTQRGWLLGNRVFGDVWAGE
jgi:putative oxygen-independent coproporphyrinogen III oxidase